MDISRTRKQREFVKYSCLMEKKQLYKPLKEDVILKLNLTLMLLNIFPPLSRAGHLFKFLLFGDKFLQTYSSSCLGILILNSGT